MGNKIMKLTTRQWASVLVVWVFLLWQGLSGGGYPLSVTLIVGTVLLGAIYLVQLAMAVGGPRLRARFGHSQ